MAKQRRIGILGGTFDPVHLGHIRMGLSVLDGGYVDRLLVVPSGAPPYKSGTADPEDRWRMVVSACSCDERLVPSRLELDRSGSSYTVDTLRSVRKEDPKASLFYVIGTDALMNLHQWRGIGEILSLCTFLVCGRAGTEENMEACADRVKTLSAMGGRFVTVPADIPPFSSTGIRASLAAGREPEGLDESVLEYCMCKGLYGYPGRLEHIDSWISGLFQSLKPARFAHSLSVALAAKRLAALHGIDPLKAEQAGLLHDCAKGLSLSDMQRVAAEHSLTDDRNFLENKALLHSVVGAQVAFDQYGMTDPEVLEAIRYHNTGCAGMSRLAMCVCLADSIEPLRKPYPMLEEIRELSLVSLEKALLLSLERTAEYVDARGYYLHPRTRDTIAWLRTLPETTG